MGRSLRIALWVLLVSAAAWPQSGGMRDALMERMAGRWVLQGTIAGRQTTHDVDVEWVLNREYLRLHEVSREKDGQGRPAYEAIVFIGWDAASGRYACLWLDSTGGGGLKGEAIAYAKRGGDELPFLFRGADGSLFHTTFAYDRKADAWQWKMDGEDRGKLQPFARVTLTRKTGSG